MKDLSEKSVSGFVKLWCEKCQFGLWRPTYWKKYACPVCRDELVVHVERKGVSDAQEKTPTETR